MNTATDRVSADIAFHWLANLCFSGFIAIWFVINRHDLYCIPGLRHNLAKSMPTPEVPEVYVTSLDTLADEYKTENKKFAEWFAKDKDKLVNDIHRMRDNTYFRKVSW